MSRRFALLALAVLFAGSCRHEVDGVERRTVGCAIADGVAEVTLHLVVGLLEAGIRAAVR